MHWDFTKFFRKRRSSFKTNVLILLTGTSISQVLQISLAPIITRLYSPQSFGVLATFMAVCSMISVIISLRYESAIMIPDKPEESEYLLFLSVFIGLIFCIVANIIIYIFPDTINFFFKDEKISLLIWLIGPTAFLLNLMNILQIWFNRVNEFRKTSLSNVLRFLIDNIVKIIIGVLFISSTSASGLITGFILGLIIADGYLIIKFFSLNYYRILDLMPEALSNVKHVAVKYKSFPLYNSWSALLNAVSIQTPVVLLSFCYGPYSAGLFALANRMLKLPAAFIGRSISQAFFKKISDNVKTGSPIFLIVLKLVGFLFLIAMVPLGGIFLGGELLFSIIFGAEWAEAGYMAKLMVGWIGMQFLASSVSPVFLALEENRALAGLQIVLFAASILPVVFSFVFEKELIYAIMLLSVSNLAAYGFYLIAILSICRKYDNSLPIKNYN